MEHVVLDEPRDACLEFRGRAAHPAVSDSFSVSAVIARASSIRHASSDFPSRPPISANDSSSNFRSRMISRNCR